MFIDYLRVGSDQSSATGAGSGTMDVSGGLVIVTNQWTIGRDLETGIVTITGGEVVNHARNVFLGVANDDHITIAGGNISTGIVTIATGGRLRAEAGIRIGQASNAGEAANGTLRIAGGRLATQRIFQGATTGISIPKIEFDGGVLEAINATNSAGFIYIPSSSATSTGLTARLKSGGVVIDSAGYDLPVFAPFLEDTSSPGGGIIKSNAGTLKLLGANSYKGATLVHGGGVVLATTSTGGGAVTANDGSLFGAAVSSVGTSLRLSGLTLNAGAGTNALNFDLGVLGNPTAPVMIVTNLTVNRTNKVNVSGAGLAAGQFTLMEYTTGSGVTAEQFELNSLPFGVSAQLVFQPNLVKLDVTAAPSLHWNGNLSADWDTNTANWLDFSVPVPPATVYSDGVAVQFDDAATTNYVNLVQALSPAAITVTNQTTNYVFTGPGAIAGAAGLRKQGTGILTVSTLLNSYAGDTTISSGTFQLGASDIIPQGSGKGNVIVNGTLDMNGFTDSINGLTGSGMIDDTSLGASTLTVGNQGVLSSFSGVITNSGGGTLKLTKTGNNALILSGNNGYAGGTMINNGTVQAAGDNVLGVGTITLNGGAISSDGSAPRTLTNALAVTAASTLGSSINNGVLTLTGPLDLNATPVRNLTVASDVLLAGGSGNGALNKLGPATLTLQGAHNWNDEVEVRNGTLIFDGAGVTNSAGIRPNCDQPNGTARLVIGSGSFYVLTGNSNLRVGATGGNPTATNIADIAGTVLIPNAGSANGRIILGQGTTIGFANLLTNALAVVRGVASSAAPGYGEFNFNGGVLQAVADNTTFMEGLTNAFIRAGGAIIDSAGFNITIAQNLLNGGGGLTKLGAGALSLNGINTYTGSTMVSNGALGGIGTIAGPVLVTGGGTFAPGNSVGMLTINNTLTLQGATVMEVSRDSGTPVSDLATGISILTYGGSLVVTNNGISALRSGDGFNLFDATTTLGSFAQVSLPALLPGLSWNTNSLGADGTITVTGTVIPPQFSAPVLSGGSLNLNSTGGVAGGTYYVLTSPDVSLPVASWTSLATNVFDGSGSFNFTDMLDPAVPQRFYLISIP